MSNHMIIIGVAALVILFIIVYVKMTIDEKKGANSEEKKKVQEIVRNMVPGGEAYTAAYGTREELNLGGGGRTITTTTKYWYYAVAFKPGDLYLVPLAISGKEIKGGAPIHYGIDDLGMAEAKSCTMTLYDEDRKEIMTLFVAASNTKDDQFHPVNIQQKEEAEAFQQFAAAYAAEINAAHGVTDVKAAKKAARKG